MDGLVPVVEHLQWFARMASEVHSLHVVGFGQRLHLIRLVVARADRQEAARLTTDAVQIATKVLEHRPNDLFGDDVLRKFDLRLGEPLTVRRLDCAVRAVVATVGRWSVIGEVVLVAAARQPLELSLAGRALAPQEPIRIEGKLMPRVTSSSLIAPPMVPKACDTEARTGTRTLPHWARCDGFGQPDRVSERVQHCGAHV